VVKTLSIIALHHWPFKP